MKKSNIKKDRLFVPRKNRLLKFLRIALWLILMFLLIKGIYVTVRPDSYSEAMGAIDSFRSDFTGYKELDSELLAFAENFVRAYLTYDPAADRDGKAYKAAIEQYTTRSVSEAAFMGRKSTCVVNYSKAYRKTAYSPTQSDIYVIVSVTYHYSERSEQSATVIERTFDDVITLKVPVAYQDNRYIVEDLPAFVVDSNKLDLDLYEQVKFEGKAVDDATHKAVLNALSKFFTAYYEQDQGVIDYFLTADADRSKFQGLGGIFTFAEISETSRVYDTNPMLALVSISVTNKAGDKVTQSFNVTIIKRDSNYYVQDMNLRTQNIKNGGTVQ